MFKNEEGFSLLELVVAVGVAGIIAAVALPTFAGLQDKATTTSATYAASASAAEALANSTIGGVNGTTSNSSYTGGASSSAASSSSASTLPQATMYGAAAGSAALGMSYITGVSSVSGVTDVWIVDTNPAHNGFKIYAPVSSFNITEQNTRFVPATGSFIVTDPYLSISYNWGSEIHDSNGNSGQSNVLNSLSWFYGFQFNVTSAQVVGSTLVINVDVPSL